MKRLLLILLILFCSVARLTAQDPGKVANKPLYRDPVFDGAADPALIWNPQVKKWWMFYTDRRANVPDLTGVTWVHGTPIGIAESADEGASWKFVSNAEFDLPAGLNVEGVTYWAPSVVQVNKNEWRMFLTFVPGIFTDWNHPRIIVQLASKDLRKWNYIQTLKLSSEKGYRSFYI
jgi:hypothetical protein